MSKGIVLAFHDENDPVLYENILLALKARYSLVSAGELEQLISKKESTRNICHISFDDGVSSFYRTVYPLLKKHKVPVSLFVSPQVISSNSNYWFQETADYDEEILKRLMSKQLGIRLDKLKKFSSQSILKCLPVKEINELIETYQQETGCGKKAPQNMSSEQLKETTASGFVTVGAHTMNHPVLKNEDDETCFYEINSSVNELAKLLGQPTSYFAYPNGRPGIDFGEREMDHLRKAGIAMAFSTELDTLSAENNLLSIPRMGFAKMGMSPSNPLINLRLKMGRKWIDIGSIGKPTEKEIRERIRNILTR